MVGSMGHDGGRGRSPLRIALWSIAALLLIAPLVAMQLTDEVRWGGADFLLAGILIGSVGIACELAVRMTRNSAYRAGAGFALAAAFFTVWANGAVGMIGNEDNSYNLFFLGVIALALLGSVAVRFHAAGMAAVTAVAGAAHAGLAIVGLSVDLRGGIFSLVFAGLWLLSAALFRNAARVSGVATVD